MKRILCLDIEGGFGGSSRSLFYTLSNMERADLSIEVWCKKAGPIQERYATLGIPTVVAPSIPKITSVRRLSRNLFQFLSFIRDWFSSREFRHHLLQALNERFDLVHINHESLYWLALWLSKRTALPITVHIRTRPPTGPFARLQAKLLAASADHFVFITENEREHFDHLLGNASDGTVIFNIANVQEQETTAYPGIGNDSRFKVLSLGNYDPIRGIDRVLEVAKAVQAMGREDIVFVFAGDQSLRGQADRLRKTRYTKTLEDAAGALGVSSHCLFLGHVSEPERVLVGCNVLIKLTREANPWGRDILEALASGLPVISLGYYDRFVQTEQTGFLLEQYAPTEIAESVVRLADDKELRDRLSASARARVSDLCDGPARAADLKNVWLNALAQQ